MMEQFVEHYRQLTERLSELITPFETEPFTAQLSLTQRTVSREALLAELDALNNCAELEGWVLLPSELRILSGKPRMTDTPVIELVVKTPQEYVQIRHDQGEQWLVQHAMVTRTEGDTSNVLAEYCTHLSIRPELGKLRFLRLWELDEQHTLRLRQSVFDGFEGGSA